MLHERYVSKDVVNRRELREYAQKTTRSTKDAGFSLARHQSDLIYNGVNVELRRNIKRPGIGFDLNGFLIDLNECKYG